MTKFSEAYAKIPRWHFIVDLTGFLSHDGSKLPRVAVRMNVKHEDNIAIITAHKEVERMIADADAKGTDAAADADLMVDMKTCQALWSAFREIDDEVSDEDQTYEYPAWPTAEWMLQKFTQDQLAVLLNLYTECRKRRGPLPFDIADDGIASLRESCATYRHTEIPELPLIPYPRREDVTLLLVEVFAMWTDERDAYERRIEDLEQQIADTDHEDEQRSETHSGGNS